MVDIVERLKILSEFRTVAPATTREAAEEIERLRSQIKQLHGLITAWADADGAPSPVYDAARNALRKAVGR